MFENVVCPNCGYNNIKVIRSFTCSNCRIYWDIIPKFDTYIFVNGNNRKIILLNQKDPEYFEKLEMYKILYYNYNCIECKFGE